MPSLITRHFLHLLCKTYLLAILRYCLHSKYTALLFYMAISVAGSCSRTVVDQLWSSCFNCRTRHRYMVCRYRWRRKAIVVICENMCEFATPRVGRSNISVSGHLWIIDDNCLCRHLHLLLYSLTQGAFLYRWAYIGSRVQVKEISRDSRLFGCL